MTGEEVRSTDGASMKRIGQRRITVQGRPVTKGRPRLGRRRKAYTPPKTIEYEALVKQAWVAKYGDTPYEGPVGMEIIIGSDFVDVNIWKMPDSKRPKYVTGDIDNYAKAISDGLNQAAYLDDKQVHYLKVGFYYG